MNKFGKYILAITAVIFICIYSLSADRSMFSMELPEAGPAPEPEPVPQAPQDTAKTKFPVAKTVPMEYKDITDEYPIDLRQPGNLEMKFMYDEKTNTYYLLNEIGGSKVVTPISLTQEQYLKYTFQKSMHSYYKKKYEESFLDPEGKKDDALSMFDMKFNLGPAEKIFGPGGVQLQADGNVTVKMAVNRTVTGNPTMTPSQRNRISFDFDEQIQANVTAKVGDKVNFGLNYNTETTFDFDTKRIKLGYEGKEDEILKVLEAGNVSMNTSNSLIKGGSALFGIRTELQFGKLRVGALLSQQESQSQSIASKKGIMTTPFEISVDAYDENRFFFLSHYFRENYDRFMSAYPTNTSPIVIEKVEVWITNTRNNYDESRNLVAFSDLAEYKASNIYNDSFVHPQGSMDIPYNSANDLYDKVKSMSELRDISQVTQTLTDQGLEGGMDYEKIENARKLNESEYTLNKQLGYISLRNAQLQPDEVLAVAYQFQYKGNYYKVGEFSTSDPSNSKQNIFVKLIKGTAMSPIAPYWKLMMKNVYYLNTYSLQKDKFRLDILYQNDTTGTYLNYINDGKIGGDTIKTLLQVMNLDRLDSRNNPYPDGFFDYVESYTVFSDNGRIIFPVVEPFGEHLRKQIGDTTIAKKYVFQELYDSTMTIAKQIAEKNKFILRGEYKGSSSGGGATSPGCHPLPGTNIAQGSVRVTVSGVTLTENVDYRVDYVAGEVCITNPMYQNSPDVRISLENRGNFGMQRKTMMGVDLQYQFNPDFSIGATLMNLREMPITMKVNMGDESVNNTQYGFNLSYRSKSQWLTDMFDKLPFLDLTAPSQISLNAEYAQLIPGHYQSKYGGNYSYIDDFERTQVELDLRNPYNWFLSSTPVNKDNPIIPDGDKSNDIAYGKNRALLAWYTIDPLFTRKNSSLAPRYLRQDEDQQSNPYVREVEELELYPNKSQSQLESATLPVFNLAFYPNERGPYNLDADGMNSDGFLSDPEKRWGGIMRRIDKSSTDFEANNYEYIEFWLLDPFIYKPDSKGGDLYINLGEISEDVLKDGKKFFENGLPINGDTLETERTVWGRVPKRQSLNYAFESSSDAAARRAQDVGFNGLGSDDERVFGEYKTYLDALQAKMNPDVFQQFNQDPSGDTYHYYRGSDYDNEQKSILDRYKKYNNPEGNSRSSEDSDESYDTSAKLTPDVEDINQDNTLNENEKYFQYKIPLKPGELEIGKNNIVDKRTAAPLLRNGKTEPVNWYLFKIPIKAYNSNVGKIADFKTIRFMRMFLHNFSDTTILRFGTFKLMKGDWRAYAQDLSNPNQPPTGSAAISVAAVNIEENGSKTPVNYVMPPGVSQVIDPGQPQVRLENEQSMSLKISDLSPGDARAVYKGFGIDTRQYRRLQMFVHAEKPEGDLTDLRDDELSIFLRLGSDYKNNYYEYEIPLRLTAPGTYKDNGSDREIVWPQSNMFDFPFEILTDLKLNRNKEKRRGTAGVSFGKVYSESDPNNPRNRISVIGNPTLSEVKVVMIGIRNNSTGKKSGEVWVDELRLTEFNEDGGWAANGNLNVSISDFGTVNFSGYKETAGFGGLEQGIMERSIDDHYRYNIATTAELGRFFPEKAQVSLPLSYAYSEQVISPKYDPLNEDVLLSRALESVETKAEKDSIKGYAQDKISTKSINMNNIKVGVKSKNPMPYDPANLNIGFSHIENKKQNATTQYETETDTRLMLGYGYSPYIKPIAPFKNSTSKSQAMKFAKEFSLNYLPNSFAFNTELARNYYEIQMRDLSNTSGFNYIPASFREDFYWTRNANIQWDLTNNLKLNFQSGTQAQLTSPHVQVNRKLNPDSYELWKDSIIESFKNWGDPLRYSQTFDATYAVPIKYIPGLEWITASLAYKAFYTWDKGAEVDPMAMTEYNLENGNIIKNERSMGIESVGLNLLALYNKVPFLKEANQKYSFKRPPNRNLPSSRKPSQNAARNAQEEAKKKKEEEDAKKKALEAKKLSEKKRFEGEIKLDKDTAVVVNHGLNNKKVRITARTANGKLYEVKHKAIDNNSIRITTRDTVDLKIVINQLPKPEETTWYKVAQATARGLMMVRNMNFSYSIIDGMMIPGFKPGIGDFTGQGSTPFGSAPGADFAFGFTDKSYIEKADARDWLVKNETNLNPAVYNKTENFSFKAALEPIPGMRIDLTGIRNSTNSENTFFMSPGMPRTYGGTFTMTTVAIGSAFEKADVKDNYRSKTFDKFLQSRQVIANRLQYAYAGVTYPDAGFISTTVYENQPYPAVFNPAYGNFSENSTDVLIPAFIAAYMGKSPGKVGLSAFPSLKNLLPNWSIKYEGLIQLDVINKHFKTFELSHRYDCRYVVGSFASFPEWVGYASSGIGFIESATSGYPVPSSPYDVTTVSITENFSPLLGLNAMFQNNVTMKMELRKTRNISLNATSYQIVEAGNNDYVIGVGYKMNEFNKILKLKHTGNADFSNDLTVSADFSYKKLQTLIRKIAEEFTQATSGDVQTMIKLSARYNLSKMLTLEAFFDKQISKPLVSSSAFPTSTSSFGVSLNVSLSR